jgi:hypothetical protein
MKPQRKPAMRNTFEINLDSPRQREAALKT